jgi:hypothetical protein
MRSLKISVALLLVVLACGFVQPANDDQASRDNVLYTAKSSGAFNNCEYEYQASIIRIFATDATDPGVYFEKLSKEVSDPKYFTFAIKGKLIKLGQWCFPVVQVYDEKDDDYTPSVTKTSFTLKNDEYSTISVPLDGKIKKLFKIQFLLVTDKGSWDVEVKDAKLE